MRAVWKDPEIITAQETQGSGVADARLGALLADADEFFGSFLWESLSGETARDALAKHGVEEGTIRAFGVGYAPVGAHEMMDRLRELDYSDEEIIASGLGRLSPRGRVHAHFRSRVMFPIREPEGQTLGFAGLATHVGPSWALWVVSPEAGLYRRSQAVFGLDRAAKQIAASKTALVVRDCIAVLRAHQQGQENAVAVHTGAVTHEQIGELGAVVPGGIEALELDLAPGMTVEPEPDPESAMPAATVRRTDGGASTEPRPRFLELKKLSLVSATAVAAMNTWTGAPLVALWLGSQAQGGRVLGLRGVVVVLVVMSVLVGLLAWLLMWLGHKYDSLTGRPVIASQTSPWHRAKRGDRVQDIRSRYGISAPEKAVVACVVAGVIGLEVWFFFYAGSPF